MATVRLTPTEIQVDQVVYVYGSAGQADAFEACVAALDVTHCVLDHPPQGTRAADDGAAAPAAPAASTTPAASD